MTYKIDNHGIFFAVVDSLRGCTHFVHGSYIIRRIADVAQLTDARSPRRDDHIRWQRNRLQFTHLLKACGKNTVHAGPPKMKFVQSRQPRDAGWNRSIQISIFVQTQLRQPYEIRKTLRDPTLQPHRAEAKCRQAREGAQRGWNWTLVVPFLIREYQFC